MSTPAKLTFSPIASTQKILFPNPQAWNNWFDAVSVSITDDNLPNATVDVIGCTKMGQLNYSYTMASYTPDYVDMEDLAGSITKVPSMADFATLQAQLTGTYNLLTALINALKASGQLTTTV